jgi:LysM repeat protein
MKRDLIIVSTLVLVMIVTSACNQAYSQAPAATLTPVSQSLFASPGPTDAMDPVAAFATGTALAELTTSPGAPGASTPTSPAGITPQAATATPQVITGATSTATLAVAQTPQTGPTATNIPPGSRPSTYTLQSGEFPWCIARRFNVDPNELLAASGLTIGQANSLSTGTVLTIPQSGKPFPENRMLHNHPDTYTVDFSSETIYGVACYYGDIDPAVIAQANGLSVSADLTAGQKLTIP